MRTSGGCKQLLDTNVLIDAMLVDAKVGWEQFLRCGLLQGYLKDEDSRLYLLFGNDFILFYFKIY